MDQSTIHAIIKTLCYSEVFSYPLTFSEVSRYLISQRKVSDRELLYALSKYRSMFEEEKGFIVLKNSKYCIKERISKIAENRKKLARAIWISQILSYIPTIQMIGISGSLSMYNARKNDDIDLFFITSKNTLWITRFLVVSTLFLLRQKRAVGKNIVKDKICPNMFITEDVLSVEKKGRNVYTAHEVAQLKITYEKNDMKDRFLQANKWVLGYMPHSLQFKKTVVKKSKNNLALNFLDMMFFIVQKYYMRKKVTLETIDKQKAFFHPIKMGNIISQMYNLKVSHRKKALEQAKPFVPTFLRAN